jgi:hypothetical protein
MHAFLGLAYGADTVFDPSGSLTVLAAAGVVALVLSLLVFTWGRHSKSRRHHPLWAAGAVLPYVAGILLAS